MQLSLSSMVAPKILVLGPADSGRHSLAQALLHLFSCKAPSSTKSEVPSLRDAKVGGTIFKNLKSVCVQIHTKYYTANVEVVVQHFADESFKDELREVMKDLIAGVQAVIFVFDARQESSFQSMKRFVEAIGSAHGGDFETRLVIANKMDLCKDELTEETVTRRIDWCSEHLLEYIEVDSINYKRDAAEDQREKQNIFRVVEALEVTMWTNMVRVDLDKSQGKDTKQAEDRELNRIRDEIPEVNDDMEEACLHNEDTEFSKLFSMVDEIKRVRSNAKHLNDKDRREAAANMALKVTRHLNLSE